MTFAQRIESAVQFAMNATPYMPSKAEICDSIQPIINELHQMPHADAVAYMRESFSHNGYQALAVRMFKGQPV
jgi:hypothetical protein